MYKKLPLSVTFPPISFNSFLFFKFSQLIVRNFRPNQTWPRLGFFFFSCSCSENNSSLVQLDFILFFQWKFLCMWDIIMERIITWSCSKKGKKERKTQCLKNELDIFQIGSLILFIIFSQSLFKKFQDINLYVKGIEIQNSQVPRLFMWGLKFIDEGHALDLRT